MDAEEFVKAFKESTRVEMEFGGSTHVVERRRAAGSEVVWVHWEAAVGRRRGGRYRQHEPADAEGADEHTEFDLWDLARWFAWASTQYSASTVRVY